MFFSYFITIFSHFFYLYFIIINFIKMKNIILQDIFEVLMYEVFPELQKNRGFNTFKFHDD